MRSGWMFLCGLTLSLAMASTLHATRQYYSIQRCQCNNRSKYCLPDALGLHCLDCQGNTEGRHCERCKPGFYQQGTELHCTACNCHPTGSVDGSCDSLGRCRCKDGVRGHRCERCEDGPMGANGCVQRRQPREDSRSLTPCFCYGHSSQCSPQSGYSVHNITSTFTNGPEDWKVATVQGITPYNTHFRWSPRHQDLEVISKNSLPIYLYAPESYLGNRLLSYGQNLSFSLRLDRGVRQPSTNDVILEGAGLRVGASLGDLRFSIPCGKKISYSFRLDEEPRNKWRPQLTSTQFKTLLQNLTAIKIRATFGENGRGYLDNVSLVSAYRGDGVPAHWVHICSCPTGYEGDFCERCSAGFRRSSPKAGAFSPCEECRCSGGLCDPLTGDCYSADQTPADRTCSLGFYSHHRRPDLCLPCPCPLGVSCWLPAGAEEPFCDRCPPGTTGPRCDTCQEGFFGDPSGASGVERPCRPCRCNGHIDPSVEGSCDGRSGECLKCLNNTQGQSCEACVRGFYHSQPTDACKPCGCDAQHSEGDQCDEQGRCQCKAGFEGLRCQRSSCPSCFSPIKTKVERYSEKLKDLEGLDGGGKAASKAELEAALKKAEEAANDLQDDVVLLTELKKKLQSRVASVSRSQLAEEQLLQDIVDKADDVEQQQQTYKAEVKEVKSLLEDMKRKLEEAKNNLLFVDIPVGDSALGSDFLSSLVKTATSLAGIHETMAEAVEKAANGALTDSQKGLDLIKGLMSRENNVKELVEDLKTEYDQSSAQAKGLETQAKRLSEEAKDESKKADNMLKDITNMEGNIPSPLKDAIDGMLSRLEGVKTAVNDNIADIEALQEDLDREKPDAEDLLAKGKDAKKEGHHLLDRVYTAKADTEGALEHLKRHTNELDGALNTLRGFDRQIDNSKTLADAAIQRLPEINSTIQQAVRNNAKTLSYLGDVSDDYTKALGTVIGLEELVNNLMGSLPSQGDVLNETSRLNTEAQDLENKAVDATKALSEELKGTEEMEAKAENVADEAAAAFSNAKQTRDAVGKALQDISTMLANINQPGAVDDRRLAQLENLLANAQRDVEDHLRPRLRNVEEQEAAQRSRLAGMDLDLDAILADISNLEDILRSVPKGCFNSPPIEEA